MLLTPADIPSGEIAVDLAIVGAGPAGITLARTLERTGRRILLVESGGFEDDSLRQTLFEGASIGETMEPRQGRYRVFGGASSRWTGRCAKLDRHDFEPRAWMRDSGWPISFEDLDRHYADAAVMCGFPRDWERAPELFARLRQLPDRPDKIEPFLWRFYSTRKRGYRNFGHAFAAELLASRNVSVLTRADLVDVVPTADGDAIDYACLRDWDGKRLRIKAGQYILACGGIENTRLMMNFAEDHPKAFGAVRDSLGRRFMQHPRTVTANIETNPRQAVKLQYLFNNFGRLGMHFETGFALSASAQQRQQLVNASAVVRYASHLRSIPRDLLARPAQLAKSMFQRSRGRVGPLGHISAEVHVDLEQIPDPDSRLLVDTRRDFLGLRKIVVDWRIAAAERRTSAIFTRAIGEWIETLGLGRFRYAPDLDDTGALVPGRLLESYHHIGGTRMSETPRTGVVDGNLKVHGLRNLYLAGASVMPTGGHANPTLTIVSLSLRLSQYMAEAIF